jgi:hypothetical protein
MGSVMRGTVEKALTWSGSQATLSLFLVAKSKPDLKLSWESTQPIRVRSYDLEDVAGMLEGRQVFEYDAIFETVPAHLDRYLLSSLEEAMNKGAELAWFGFEGSFDYEHLLAPEIATQIYALADAAGVAIAVEDLVLNSEAWRERVATARGRIV